MTKKAIAMKAMKDLFVKRDSTALYRYWASDHTQHNPRMSNGHEGIQEVMPHIPEHFSYDPGIVIEEGNIVMAHSRVVGLGNVPQIIVDIFRFENGKIVEHWDVIQEEVTAYHSKNGNPMTSSPVS